VIGLLGKSRIGAVIADREFVGKEWMEYLLQEKIAFFLRVPKSYLFTINGVVLKAENLLQARRECKIDNVTVIGVKGISVGIKRVQDSKGQDDYLIVLTNTLAYQALRVYKKRWSIEAMFQDFKSQGFHLESTHVKEGYKLKKLVYLVSIAYAFCVHMGLYYEKYIALIKVKNHGYRSKSLFRKGLDILRSMIERKKQADFNLWQQMVEAFIHLATLKMLDLKKS
jgi:Transposase DDE domain